MDENRSQRGGELWVGVGSALLVLLSALSGLLFGWAAVHLQFFGETADAGDHLTAVGAYGAAAAVLALSVAAVLSLRGPRWVAAVAGCLAVAEGSLAASAWQHAVTWPDAAERALGYGSVRSGAEDVLALPWNWPLLVAGLVGPVLALRRRSRDRAVRGAR